MDSSHDEEAVLDRLEIDLEIADIGDILAAHGINPTPDLVMAIWEWKESRANALMPWSDA